MRIEDKALLVSAITEELDDSATVAVGSVRALLRARPSEPVIARLPIVHA